MRRAGWRVILACMWCASFVASTNTRAQTTMLPSIVETLSKPLQPPAVTEFQLEQYLMRWIPPLPSPSTPELWTAEEKQLRKHMLEDVAFQGWPREWIESAPRFEQVGVIETDHGYRIRKLRYEIVPAFSATALLYEPEKIAGRVPAVLDLLGHEPDGVAVEYEQKRCINFAKRGIVALNLEWMQFEELSQPDNGHDYAAHLDLVGSNALGLFYLAMRRGLDYLATLPEVDPARIGATGLSGGGWQTVLLGALHARVAVSVEVAGIGSRESNLTAPGDTYEIEEDAPDIMRGFDYPEFVAMRAPRPTLLVHNAVDSCCFRASLVEPYIYSQVKPFFQMFGAADVLAWHENFDPGIHNYQLDNRIQPYRFFTKYFHLPVAENAIFSDGEIRNAETLAVGVPAGNLTILGLARKLAGNITRQPIPAAGAERTTWIQSQRERLKSVVRYQPVSMSRALRITNSNGLSATGIRFKQDASPEVEPVTIVLNDKGYKAAGQDVFDRLSSGHEVFALDLLFNGATLPEMPDSSDWELLVDASGDRSLGLEVAQLLAFTKWVRSSIGSSRVQIVTDGIRSQTVAFIAALIEPEAFANVTNRNAMRSFLYLLDKPVPLRSAPELFCLDLYKDFDIDSISALAPLVSITQLSVVDRKILAIGPYEDVGASEMSAMFVLRSEHEAN
jgi:dienelactone hydrolase